LVGDDRGRFVNLKEWARTQGVHPRTAYRRYRQGRLPVPARRADRLILVDAPLPPRSGRVVVSARVSAADRAPDLDRQVARGRAWAGERGLAAG